MGSQDQKNLFSMKKKASRKWKSMFDSFAARVTRITGTPTAFISAFVVIIAWAVTGPLFHYSDTWQLVINTGTTIITFLMVFVIQQSQNKDTVALQIKLNELIAASKEASNRLISVEDLSPEELDQLKKFYIELANLAKKEHDLKKSHTIEEAVGIHEMKSHRYRKS